MYGIICIDLSNTMCMIHDHQLVWI